jgi:cysteine-rich repeat protein
MKSYLFGRASALAAATFLVLALSPGNAFASVVCGDLTFDFNEGCEDSNATPDDGCTNCLIDDGYPCNIKNVSGLTGNASCGSGVCDTTEEPDPICEPAQTCGNGLLESSEGCDDGNTDDLDGCNASCLVEDGSPCNQGDNAGAFGDSSCESGVCDESVEPTALCVSEFVSTTVTTTSTTTSTTEPTSTTTTSTTSSTSTTEEFSGACCYSGGCQNVNEGYCIIELLGSFQGEGTSCTSFNICGTCGNGCLDFGEECDDADTTSGDGCSDKCSEERCFTCTEGQLSDARAAVCVGPSQCSADEVCAICGNGEIEAGEQCDDGETPGGCCDPQSCQFVASGTSCLDDFFCNGPESCDGSGNCVDSADPVCGNGGNPCQTGFCDPKADACVTENVQDGSPCSAGGSCVVGSGGECDDGVCTGDASTLSPTCRWIIVGGSSQGEVRVRTGPGSTVDADMCGDTARIGGITTDDIVAIAASGEGVRFYGPPAVHGDIVTGGASVRSNLYLTIPGTEVKMVDTGMTQAKTPAGVVDTTGNHALVDVCDEDQTILQDAIATLDLMASTGSEFLKIGVGSSFTIDVTGDGLAVIDMNQLRVGHGATLTLRGNADDVVMLRVNQGRMKIGYGGRVTLDGLVPENVLIYADGSRCRVSPGVVGAGTIFCPAANRFIIGAGVDWQGTFLGAARELRVRSNATLTHVPFTGF